MKKAFLFCLFFSSASLACISDPVYVDLNKVKQSAEASGRNIIIQSAKPIVFPKVEGLKFHPRLAVNLTGQHQYEIQSKVELSREYEFELEIGPKKKIVLKLHIPPLLQGECLNLDGVKYN